MTQSVFLLFNNTVTVKEVHAPALPSVRDITPLETFQSCTLSFRVQETDH